MSLDENRWRLRLMRFLVVFVVVSLEILAASSSVAAMDSGKSSDKGVVVTTTLSGGGKSGASITVGLGTPVTDQATLSGFKAGGGDDEDENAQPEPDDATASAASDATSTDSAEMKNKNKSGTISYEVYSDSACTTRVFDATPSPNVVVKGVAPRSNVFTSPTGGVFYWIARYSGDKKHAAAAGACG